MRQGPLHPLQADQGRREVLPESRHCACHLCMISLLDFVYCLCQDQAVEHILQSQSSVKLALNKVLQGLWMAYGQ